MNKITLFFSYLHYIKGIGEEKEKSSWDVNSFCVNLPILLKIQRICLIVT
jgi:hypothetical protein